MEELLTALRDRLVNDAGTGRARQATADRLGALLAADLEEIGSQSALRLRESEARADAAAEEDAFDRARRHWVDPAVTARARDVVRAIARRRALREGADASEVSTAEAVAESGLHRRMIDHMLSLSPPDAELAEAYLGANRDSMTAGDVAWTDHVLALPLKEHRWSGIADAIETVEPDEGTVGGAAGRFVPDALLRRLAAVEARTDLSDEDRAGVAEMLEGRAARAAAERREAQAAARGAALDLIDAAGKGGFIRYGQLPPSIRDHLSAEDEAYFRAYARNGGRPPGGQGGDYAASHYRRLAVEDREAFIASDLDRLRGRIGGEALAELTALQERMREGPGSPEEMAHRAIWEAPDDSEALFERDTDATFDAVSNVLSDTIRNTVAERVAEADAVQESNAHTNRLLEEIASGRASPQMALRVREMLNHNVSDADITSYDPQDPDRESEPGAGKDDTALADFSDVASMDSTSLQSSVPTYADDLRVDNIPMNLVSGGKSVRDNYDIWTGTWREGGIDTRTFLEKFAYALGIRKRKSKKNDIELAKRGYDLLTDQGRRIPTTAENAVGKDGKVITMSTGISISGFGVIDVGHYYTDKVTGTYITVGGISPIDAKNQARALLKDLGRYGISFKTIRPTGGQYVWGEYESLKLMTGHGVAVSLGTGMPYSPVYSQSWSYDPSSTSRTQSGHSAGVGVKIGTVSGQYTYTILVSSYLK